MCAVDVALLLGPLSGFLASFSETVSLLRLLGTLIPLELETDLV